MIINWSPVKRACGIKHPILRESLAELLGTATLVVSTKSFQKLAVEELNEMEINRNVAAGSDDDLRYCNWCRFCFIARA